MQLAHAVYLSIRETDTYSLPEFDDVKKATQELFEETKESGVPSADNPNALGTASVSHG